MNGQKFAGREMRISKVFQKKKVYKKTIVEWKTYNEEFNLDTKNGSLA
jgi:hypothetical protein